MRKSHVGKLKKWARALRRVYTPDLGTVSVPIDEDGDFFGISKDGIWIEWRWKPKQTLLYTSWVSWFGSESARTCPISDTRAWEVFVAHAPRLYDTVRRERDRLLQKIETLSVGMDEPPKG